MLVSCDSETFPITTECLTPPPVCYSFANELEPLPLLLTAEDGLDELERYLDSSDVALVFHFGPFDLAVAATARPRLLRKIFRAYREGRITDTRVCQQLLDIAIGRQGYGSDGDEARYRVWNPASELWETVSYNLADLTRRHLGKDREAQKHGPDSVRLRYGELYGKPLSEWPQPFIDYALEDAVDTLHIRKLQGRVADEVNQVRADWVLYLASVVGLTVDQARVDELEAACQKRVEELHVQLRQLGFYRPNGTKDTKFLQARVADAFAARGLKPPVTKKKQGIRTDADTLLQTGDPILEAMSKNGPDQTVLRTFVPALKRGENIHARFNVLVNNGRPSCRDPNFYNLPRKLGVRECIVAPPGYYLCSVDWDAAEFRTWGQVCQWLFGYSDVAKFFRENPDGDPHLELACSVLGISYAEGMKRKKAKDVEVVDKRQGQKPVNFGLPGGMGVRTLIESARKSYGVAMSWDDATTKIQGFGKRWREYWPYRQFIKRLMAGGPRQVKQYISGRLRTVHRFADCANGFWSALLADMSKYAFWLVTQEAYCDETSPLYGTRPVLSLYDEILALVPIEKAHEAAHRIRDIMCNEAPPIFTPDVPMTAEPALMLRWSKEARTVYENGRLVPYDFQFQPCSPIINYVGSEQGRTGRVEAAVAA